MALITPTFLFRDLDDWPGRFFSYERSEVTFLSRTSTSLTWRLLGGEFPDYTITATGTGFAYEGRLPIAGVMSSLTIRDPLGATVVTVSGLTGLPSDQAEFVSTALGSPIPDRGPGPAGHGTWSLLLSGNDTFNGTSGEDRMQFPGVDAGNDIYNLYGGDDQVNGGIGNDTYFGGAGYDEFSFNETHYNPGESAFRGATINRQTGVVYDPWGGTDRIFSFEEYIGSRFNDVFIGSLTEDDNFTGLRGADTFRGGAASFVNGVQQNSDRHDEVDYRDDHGFGGTLGLIMRLETELTATGNIRGYIRDGFGRTDVVFDIEHVTGTRYNDSFIGSRMDNRFAGMEGRDTYDGGAGFDIIRFNRTSTDDDPTGVNVNLALTTGQIINDGFGNTENAVRIEGLWGSENADILRGNALDNELLGYRGADTLSGQGGSDTFVFYAQEDFNAPDRVTDFNSSGTGIDTLAFGYNEWEGMTSTLRLVNGTAATNGFGTFLFVNATDQLIWDSNGNGAGGQTLVAILNGVSALSAANFELWG